jgi:hypothetical protein
VKEEEFMYGESTKCNHYVNEIGSDGNGVGKYLIFSRDVSYCVLTIERRRREKKRHIDHNINLVYFKHTLDTSNMGPSQTKCM